MPNHCPVPRKLWDDTSKLFHSWSPRHLIVFVHGFGGTNDSTWRKFQTLLVDDPACASYDLLFYGYDSNSAINSSAGLLYDRCNEFLTAPHRFHTPHGFPRQKDFRYDKIVFVGHSLGGPVVRQMALNAKGHDAEWLANIRMAFFAPATSGAYLEKLLAEVAAWDPTHLLHLYYVVSKFLRPVMRDLPAESDMLRDIREKTIEQIRLGNSEFQSLITFFGEKERVIDQSKRRLDFDWPFADIARLGHVNICKPQLRTDQVYLKFRTALGW